MAETPDGQAAAGPRGSDDGDPDSPARSFFSRLFRRDADGGAESPASQPNGAAAGPGEMLVNLRNMRTLHVDDVRVPRAEVVAVAIDAPLEQVVEVFKASALSRLPVYEDSLDNPVGQLHFKDLALRYGFGAGAGEFELRPLLRPLLYAPPSMPIGALLQRMQAAHVHMALVIDEYGGVDGLVTIEDLIEQIVGDIDDEHDVAEGELFTREAPGVFLAQGRVELEDFEAAVGERLAEGELAEDVDTLGGLVFRLSGRVPAQGEVVAHPAGHAFEVLDADARNIKRLRVRLRGGETAGSAGAAG